MATFTVKYSVACMAYRKQANYPTINSSGNWNLTATPRVATIQVYGGTNRGLPLVQNHRTKLLPCGSIIHRVRSILWGNFGA